MKSKEQAMQEHDGDGYRPYDLQASGFGQMMPEKSCAFCRHCTDIWYDFCGIYMAFCEIHEDAGNGLNGKCRKFEEDL